MRARLDSQTARALSTRSRARQAMHRLDKRRPRDRHGQHAGDTERGRTRAAAADAGEDRGRHDDDRHPLVAKLRFGQWRQFPSRRNASSSTTSASDGVGVGRRRSTTRQPSSSSHSPNSERVGRSVPSTSTLRAFAHRVPSRRRSPAGRYRLVRTVRSTKSLCHAVAWLQRRAGITFEIARGFPIALRRSRRRLVC